MADEWDDIEIPEQVSVPEPVKVEEPRAPTAAELKRLESIAARKAESALLDAERKARQDEKAAIKKQEEEERIARALACRPIKSEFEAERDEFVIDFIEKQRAADKKVGKGYKWAARSNSSGNPMISVGELAARDAALTAWKKFKGL
jgi:hypothetical protein